MMKSSLRVRCYNRSWPNNSIRVLSSCLSTIYESTSCKGNDWQCRKATVCPSDLQHCRSLWTTQTLKDSSVYDAAANSTAEELVGEVERLPVVRMKNIEIHEEHVADANDVSAWVDVHPDDEPEEDPQQSPKPSGYREFMRRKSESAEISDPNLIFKKAISNLRNKYGEDIVFPRYIIWLAGAPGAGKGTMTPYIMKETGISAPPLVMSDLLTGPIAQEAKERGRLLGDREVVEALFEALINQHQGVIVDGFPRTKCQAECIKLLYETMMEKYRENLDRPESPFPRPVFHIVVLYVEEQESVARQLARGKALRKHNQCVKDTGIGRIVPERATDMTEDTARDRYRLFKEQVYESLMVIKNAFHFHFIDAGGTTQEVMGLVKQEFEYQSKMELSDEALQKIRRVPKASRLIQNARMELVKRLDTYTLKHPALFDRVVDVISEEFVHILRRQVLAGKAIVRSQNSIFDDGLALNMFLDVMHDRGYIVVLDVMKHDEKGKTFIFHVEFPRPQMRHNLVTHI